MRHNDRRAAKPATATQRKGVSWNLTQVQIDARLAFCADPDVHGVTCCCVRVPPRHENEGSVCYCNIPGCTTCEVSS